ncbi:hypothetical protein EON65_39010 [archaeon]|nr:MAG: hypothetical protein EON65_39010 [archaeon]
MGGFDPSSVIDARNKMKGGGAGGVGSGAAGAGRAGGVDGDGGVGGSAPLIDAMDIALADLSRLDVNELSGFEKQLARAAREARKDEQLLAEKASKEESELMKQMFQVDEAVAISGSQIGSIVNLGADEISSASAMYAHELEEAKRELDENLATGKLGAAAAFNRQMQNLSKQVEELTVREKEQAVRIAALKQRIQVAADEKASSLDYVQQLQAQYKKFVDLEATSSQKRELTTIKNLMALVESLKQKEIDFKAQCKSKRNDYLERIKQLEEEEDQNTPEMAQQRQIEEMHGKVLAKYNHVREMLAEVNQEVASAQRLIDDTPSRTELIQYERRFAELYQQVAFKLEETRKYYDMYNALDSTLSFMQKEVSFCLPCLYNNLLFYSLLLILCTDKTAELD